MSNFCLVSKAGKEKKKRAARYVMSGYKLFRQALWKDLVFCQGKNGLYHKKRKSVERTLNEEPNSLMFLTKDFKIRIYTSGNEFIVFRLRFKTQKVWVFCLFFPQNLHLNDLSIW